MRVALLSDIHGNSDALAVVLEQARERGVERLLIAGDFVGYYYDPDRVLRLLNEWDWIGVRGNHEEILASWLRGEEHESTQRRYGSGTAAASAMLSTTDLEKLTRLPHPLDLMIDGRHVLICHGTPAVIDKYVYPDQLKDNATIFTEGGHDLIVYGHTHYPVVHRFGRSLVVNPGSVGQPRDRNPASSWAMWDSASGDAVLFRTSYDTQPLVSRCRHRDPQVPYLAEVLIRRA